MKMTHRRPGLWLLLLQSFLDISQSQFRVGTPQYYESINAGVEELNIKIQSHPDVKFFFDPSSVLIDNSFYVYNYPLPEYYRIVLAVDPCRYLNYDCCMNVFGTPEYPALIKDGLEPERAVRYTVLGSEVDVQVNYQTVFEDGSLVSSTALRASDDDQLIDLNCKGRNNPFDYCMGKNYAYKRSNFRPACADNNSTLNTLAGCYSPEDGSYHPHCVQVGYGQNAFISQCGVDDDDCGTFLEIHMIQGSPYQEEKDVIADVRINTRNISGMYTTMLPMTWMGNHTKVLCSYEESFLRVGSIVYILPIAPKCCCPETFTPSSRVGSFFCPKGATGNGAYATAIKDLSEKLTVDTVIHAYPFCHSGLESGDHIMCSKYDVHDQRHFTHNCSALYQSSSKSNSWTSNDLNGTTYDDICPFFDTCALSSTGKCTGDDFAFSFVGQVGRVTHLESSLAVPLVWVTFNDGRTSYVFEQQQVQLEYRKKSMYEIWWVVRSKTYRTIQKRKGFNVTEPQCTFDLTNNRYFPFASLGPDGKSVDSSYQ